MVHHQGDEIRMCTEPPVSVSTHLRLARRWRSLTGVSGKSPEIAVSILHRPDDGHGVGLRNVGSYKSLNAAGHPRNLY